MCPYRRDFEDELKYRKRGRKGFDPNLNSRSTHNFNFLKGWGRLSNRTPYKEVIFTAKHREISVKALLNYVANPEKAEEINVLGHSYDLKDTQVINLVNQWEAQNTQLKGSTSLHLTFSVNEKPGNQKANQALHQAVTNLQHEFFTSLGYESLFTIHKDTENLHAHFIVQKLNPLTNRKLQTPKPWIQAVRQEFANELRKQGLNYRATTKKDRDLLQDNTKQQTNAWILQKAKQFYGTDGIRFVRKALIEQSHKDPKRADKAQAILTAFRQLKQPAQQQFFEEKLQTYSQQYQKYQLKQLAEKQAVEEGLAPKTGEAYVDSLFAQRKWLLDKTHSQNEAALKRLNDLEQEIQDLQFGGTTLKPKLIKFAEHKQAKQQADKIIRSCPYYGEIGQIFLKEQYLNLERTKNPADKKIIQQALKRCLNGEYTIENMQNYLWERSPKNLTHNAKQQIATYTEQVALAAQVKPTKVKLIPMLYQTLLLDSVHKPSLALANFEKNLQNYAKALSLGNQEQLQQLEQSLEKRLKLTKNLQFTPPQKTHQKMGLNY